MTDRIIFHLMFARKAFYSSPWSENLRLLTVIFLPNSCLAGLIRNRFLSIVLIINRAPEYLCCILMEWARFLTDSRWAENLQLSIPSVSRLFRPKVVHDHTYRKDGPSPGTLWVSLFAKSTQGIQIEDGHRIRGRLMKQRLTSVLELLILGWCLVRRILA